MNPIQPRNLTARATRPVAGNPTSTRFENAVANCFPGLEWDVRELDRRFFPGIVFQYVTTPLTPLPGTLPNQQGARLAYLDSLDDPMLPPDSNEPWVQVLLATLEQNIGQPNPLASGRWYLEWFEQFAKRFVMRDATGQPLDGEVVWRLVRGIQPDEELKIAVLQRDDKGNPAGQPVVLKGRRRHFVDSAGVIDASFKPGELTMSMCNPWSHDFRDCGCHYWAANHPDVVFGPADELLEDGQALGADTASIRLDWLRSDRTVAGRVAAGKTDPENRPYEMDHFEINARWKELPFVIEGREIGATYAAPLRTPQTGFSSLTEVVTEIEAKYAPMELTLALEYLTAMFSVRAPDEIDTEKWPTLAGDVQAIRQNLLLIAVGEMQHLRSANRILWMLSRDGHYPKGETYQPVLEPSDEVQTPGPSGSITTRPRRLAPVTRALIDEFIAIERPGGDIDTAYAKIVATLLQDDSTQELAELAVRIDTDGNEHYERFREVRRILARYPDGDGAPYRRPFRIGTPSECRDALNAYQAVLADLGKAYADEAKGESHKGQDDIALARVIMAKLQTGADALARKGIAIPYWATP